MQNKVTSNPSSAAITRASKYQNFLLLGLLPCLAFVSLLPALRAQSQRSAADIIRQGQERQRAIEKAGEDLRRSAQEVFDREQRRRDEEREEQARDREQEAQERRERDAERQRRSQEEQLENVRRLIEVQAENQRQLQQNINRTLQQDRATQAVAPGSSTGAINPEIVPASRSATPTEPLRVTANALPGNPNDATSVRKDWGPWEHVSGNIWVSYCKVSNKFDKGRPLWTWALKNWNDHAVKTVWFEYSEDGQWRKDLTPYSLKPRDSHGGWGSFTAVGDTPPSIRIQEVEFK